MQMKMVDHVRRIFPILRALPCHTIVNYCATKPRCIYRYVPIVASNRYWFFQCLARLVFSNYTLELRVTHRQFSAGVGASVGKFPSNGRIILWKGLVVIVAIILVNFWSDKNMIFCTIQITLSVRVYLVSRISRVGNKIFGQLLHNCGRLTSSSFEICLRFIWIFFVVASLQSRTSPFLLHLVCLFLDFYIIASIWANGCVREKVAKHNSEIVLFWLYRSYVRI